MGKILVTGGTGYIGSHTVVELQTAGYDVVIVDNLYNSSIFVLDGIKEITGVKPEFKRIDLKDTAKTDTFFSENTDIDAVIHFAAYKSVEESVNKPLDYYINNVSSLMNVLTAMKKYCIPNIVFSSSCCVYGQADILPVTEESPRKQAESPYGTAKAMCEDILRDSSIAYEFNAIALRYFNPIGAHPSGLIGETPFDAPNNLLPFITQTVYGEREKLFVFGNDYNTVDGTGVRDYIDVVDLAKAHVSAINRLLTNPNNSNYEFFNIGTGKGLSVIEIIKAFEQATGEKVNYEVRERRAGDIEQIWADTSLANTVLGWKAKTSIEDTLKNAWRWEKAIRERIPKVN